VHGKPSLAFPVPLHDRHSAAPLKWLTPFPPQTMHATLAPNGFFPVPEQKTQALAGFGRVEYPVPLQVVHCEAAESNANGSFPLPLQNAHLVTVFMAMRVCIMVG
jgi:hypothetical protein